MGEEILIASAQDIVKRLISLGIDEIGLIRGVEKEVKKLQSILGDIHLVLQEAEKKQVEDERVRRWLDKLKEAALDAEDILEEFAYDGLRRQVVVDEPKVRKFFSCFSTLALHSKTAHSIRNICKRVEDIDKERKRFCFKENINDSNDNVTIVNARESTSLVDDLDVVGRDTDKLKIVNILMHGSINNDNSTLSIVAIVGLGGLGKTTLAQLVFNDHYVKEHFGLMTIWVCVSEDFAITMVWSKILKEINSSIQSESLSKQEVQKHIKEQLNGKKFLLILDDFWQKDLGKWEELILPFKLYGGAGSKIVVTTREEIVALNIGAQDKHYLHILSVDQCLTLFESRAFVQGGPEKTPNLVEIGREIVKKCRGLPLAVKVLGGLMRSKTSEKEWLAIRDSEIWESSVDVQKMVMGVLKLSYDNLPPNVRQCFLYCSIFPKDYEIRRYEVIQLWMAQGFIKTCKKGELMEDIGDEYIKILCTISFFQITEFETVDEELTYKMHDLVHDLAKYLCRSECKGARDADDEEINEDLRHLSLISSKRTFEIPEGINNAKKLRTFYLFHHNYVYFYDSLKRDLLPELLGLRLLRVLDLSRLPLRELPSSIGGLKLLKYLNLNGSKIERLSSTITDLYNLQTLNLSDCDQLSELPKSVETLTQLRHFYISCYGAEIDCETPRGLNELHFLQTLDILKLCAESASAHIAELEHLNHLGGTLQIFNLGDVKSVQAAKQANLMRKKNLHKLNMYWNSLTQGNNIFHDAEVLEALQPNANLKELRILCFQGMELPWWITNGPARLHLVKLELRCCNECIEIKSLGELPSLKELEIEEMSSLIHIGEDNHDHQVAGLSSTTSIGVPEAAATLYPCLEKLLLRNLPILEEWFERNANGFPKLKELELGGCPSLRNMPDLFPSLQKLAIQDVKSTDTVRSIINNITSLTSLFWVGSFETVSFEEVVLMLGKNTLLQNLSILECEGLETFPHLPPSLEELEILYSPTLKIEASQLPCLTRMSIRNINAFVVDTLWSNKLIHLSIKDVEEFQQLPVDFLFNNEHLHEIYITRCYKFQGFLSSNKKQVWPSPPSSSPSCLKTLCLEDCPSVLSLGLQFQVLTQLQNLRVCGCTGLKSLEGLQFLSNIEDLAIGQFSEELNYFPFLDATEMNYLISSLRRLSIHGWPSLKSLPEQLQHLRGLEFLEIYDFDGIVDLPEWFGKLISLESIAIWRCKNLKHLPSANEMQKLTSLKQLDILNCPLLKERYSNSEWGNLSRIPKVSFH